LIGRHLEQNLEQAQKPQRQSLSNRSARQFRNFDLAEKAGAYDTGS
jgi:hypothetical protein